MKQRQTLMSRESGLAQAVRLMNEPRTDIKISHNSTCRKHMTKCTRAEMPSKIKDRQKDRESVLPIG